MDRRHTIVFYDGHCGLCHRAVRFALHHDTDGSRFRFAPLQGETFAKETASIARESDSDSIVVLPANGIPLQRSDAVILMLEELGGGWRQVGRGLAIVPRFLRDLVYRAIAGVRHRLFSKPTSLCPVVPENLTIRFLP